MLSVIIPTYNERGNIGLLLSRLFPLLPPGSEMIIVDDSSPDGTAQGVEVLSKKLKSIRLLSRPGKSGLTSAVCDGVAQSKGDWILVMDADLSHPPESVPSLIGKAGLGKVIRAEGGQAHDANHDGCDLVIGSRASVEHWPLRRKIISKGADMLSRMLLGVKVSDPLSGYFLLRKSIFVKTKFRTKGYKLLLNIIYDNPGIKISQASYAFRDRHAGKTKLGMMEMLRFVQDIIAIRFG
jgi:dolichol-phosphate mannosyltransferase